MKQSRALLVAATLASVARGVCSVLMVSQITAALAVGGTASAGMAWRFGLTVLALWLSHMLCNVLFERLSHRTHANMRRLISDKVMNADYVRLEHIGPARIQSVLAEHSTNVAAFFVSVPAILTNTIVVCGCMVYMALLSWQVFAIAVAVVGLGMLGYHWAHLHAIRYLRAASVEQDALFSHFRAMTDGAKELRLNRRKRSLFGSEVLGGSIESVRRQRTLGMSIFVMASSWGNFLIYAFIGLVLFVLVGDVPDRARVMTGFSILFIYMITPLEVLLMNLPRANMAKVSAAHIADVMSKLEGAELAPALNADVAPAPPLRRLSLEGVVHRYYHEQHDDFFTLGPIELAFRAGELVFLVGGNGSGKTTLAKMVAGLYPPDQGAVTLNGEVVDDASRDRYRQNFSAVFSDFHLFDRLLESGHADLDEEGNRLLRHLYLHHKVQLKDGAFTTRALSQGQRKRLALVVAYLEDRPFFIFDEWAADQDPLFKKVFYHDVLPGLRAAGKAVLVITHDDQYFHLADRLVKMENGQVIFDGVPAAAATQEPGREPGRMATAEPLSTLPV